jgi:signal transduction histidine kinase
MEGDVDMLPTAYAREFYLAVREAVRNALIHSGSPTLDVSLSATEGLITAVVADTGCGLELERMREAHNQDRVGLTSMQERIDLLGWGAHGGQRAGSRQRRPLPGAGCRAPCRSPPEV